MFKLNKYFIPYIIFLLFIGYRGQIIYAFMIVFIHELTHYMCARAYGFLGFDIEILAVGTVLKLEELDSADYKEDMIISLSGPVMNIFLAGVFYILYSCYPIKDLYILFAGNMAIGIFNFIPAFPLDGGRVLRDVLCSKLAYRKANKILMSISIILGILLIFFYVMLFFSDRNNFSIGIIGLFIIVCSLKEKERIPYIIMGDIIRKRYKFLKKGYIENKMISVHYKKDLLNLMSLIDKNKYSVFTILDDEMKVLEVLYEEDIINGLKIYGNMSIDEFINNHY